MTTVAPAVEVTCLPETLACPDGQVVRVIEPVVFGTGIDEDLRLLRLLQDVTSRTVRLDWVISGQPLVALRDRVHLVPPSTSVGQETHTDLAAWRSGYRYGAFYYRVGPGFVTVKDIRPDGEHARFTIDGPSCTAFLALANAHRIDELDDTLTEALQDARDLGLAVRGDAEFLVLPLRMRRWPVPYSAV
jgi:hypothetical protein